MPLYNHSTTHALAPRWPEQILYFVYIHWLIHKSLGFCLYKSAIIIIPISHLTTVFRQRRNLINNYLVTKLVKDSKQFEAVWSNLKHPKDKKTSDISKDIKDPKTHPQSSKQNEFPDAPAFAYPRIPELITEWRPLQTLIGLALLMPLMCLYHSCPLW